MLAGPARVSRRLAFRRTAGLELAAPAGRALIKHAITADQGSAKYLVAASGSQTTAPIISATGKPVVTIGGFNGSDPAPTVAQLAHLVHSGQLRYVLLGGAGGPGVSETRRSRPGCSSTGPW